MTGDAHPLDPLAALGGDEASDDAVLAAMVDVERALLRAWGELEEVDVAAEAARLDAARLNAAALAEGNALHGNPVIALLAGLREQVPAEGPARDLLHRGATSQDVVDTALVLVVARSLPSIRHDLVTAGERLAELADRHVATLQVGRTLTQHAAPITFGTTAAGWLDGVTSAIDGLDRLSLPVQLGGSVGTGTAIALSAEGADAPDALRTALAAWLELDDPGRSWHTERTPILRIAAALTATVGAAGRIGAAVSELARSEVAEVAVGSGGASSAMPQKRNPVLPVLLVSAARRAPGALSVIAGALVAEDQRPAGAWHSEWPPLRELLVLALQSAAALSQLAAGLSVDVERMRDALDSQGGAAWAEPASALLARRDGPSAASAAVREALAAAESDHTSHLLDRLGLSRADLERTVFDRSSLIVDAAVARFRRVAEPGSRGEDRR
ncbi:3-carboxy-cis,cis-muconate cycloisomerase [Cnuibacter physcomitrellae]|uniref:Uncharacterized protein n=1 Tax=Cnuibacter physcomitrellae TaxID=1619308 RepID=A0A1X9LGH7_9MICO|nr:lyase family protein [Cnuibacter physcomitrellae]ARJ04315.1 hypothetical protein B5808_03020 [Cnuibacter physcomitrellae]GGI40750.1 3-carboxy-cis,cis-muconate cycloisomerase [Cnuibacter physcomitrellae]